MFEPNFEPNKESLLKELRHQGIKDKNVLEAISDVDRAEFVPSMSKRVAYLNRPLAIGEEQTISQPYVVALITELLNVTEDDRILEVGTGSGYQAAVLAHLAKEVYSIEIISSLGEKSAKLLKDLNYSNVFTKIGDGSSGWPEKAPFDKIVISAAAPKVPPLLLEQLKEGGILVAPLGDERQALVKTTKTSSGLKQERIIPVMFVPMTGEIRSDRTSH